MKHLATIVAVALAVPILSLAKAQPASAVLPVRDGLVCWYDAAVGVTTGSNGAIQSWNDLSGGAHHATPGGSGAPMLALNQINSKPMVQFRGNWLALASRFYLDGKVGIVNAGSVSGTVVKLKLTTATAGNTITYLMDKEWDPANLLYGQNGIAALTFCEVPISPAKPNP